jgi:hypothetical protein
VAELGAQVQQLRADNAAANDQLDRVKELTAVEANKRSQLLERGHMQVRAAPSRRVGIRSSMKRRLTRTHSVSTNPRLPRSSRTFTRRSWRRRRAATTS